MSPADSVAGTIAGVLTDLHEVNIRVATGLPMDAVDTETTTRILDKLAGELGEAAAMLRRDAGLPTPGHVPGAAQPGGGWISGPCT